MAIFNYPIAGGKSYKIVYDTDGGIPIIPSGKKKKGGAATPYWITQVTPVKITEEIISEKKVLREHEFVRWLGDDGKFYYPNDLYIEDKNLSLLAKYIKIYKITYDVNGSSTEIKPNPDKKYEDQPYTITDTVPIAPGLSETYTFLNWLGNDEVKYSRSGTYLTNADLTLVAQYGNPSPLANFTYSGTWFYTGWKEATTYSDRMPNLGIDYNSSAVQNRIKNYNDLCIALVTDGNLLFSIEGLIDISLVGGGGSGAVAKATSSSSYLANLGNPGTATTIYNLTANGGGGGSGSADYGAKAFVSGTGGSGGLSGGSASASVKDSTAAASRPSYSTEQINAVRVFGELQGLVMSGGGGGGAICRKAYDNPLILIPGKYPYYYKGTDSTYEYTGYNPSDGYTNNGNRNASSGVGYKYTSASYSMYSLDGCNKFGAGSGGIAFVSRSTSSSGGYATAAGGGGGGCVTNKLIYQTDTLQHSVIIGKGGAGAVSSLGYCTSGKGGDGVVLIRACNAITWYTYAFAYSDWEKYLISEYNSVDDCLNAEYGSTSPSTPSSLNLYWEEDITFEPSATTAEFIAISSSRDNLDGITSAKLKDKLKKFSDENSESCCWIKNGQASGDNIYFDGWYNLFGGKEIIRIDKIGLRNKIIPDKSSELTVLASPYAHYDGEIYNGRVWYSYSLKS